MATTIARGSGVLIQLAVLASGTGRLGVARRHVVADFKLMWALIRLSAVGTFQMIVGMVSWIGLRQVPIQYDRAARTTGASNYPLARMVGLAFDALTSFSIMPLRLASYLGLALGVLSLLMVGYTLGSWALGSVVEGWTSLLTVGLGVSSSCACRPRPRGRRPASRQADP